MAVQTTVAQALGAPALSIPVGQTTIVAAAGAAALSGACQTTIVRATGGSSVWTPASLGSTLKGWFEADFGVTGSPVTAFQNQVAGGGGTTDEGFGDGPLYAANGAGLNNRPRLVFDGTHHMRNLIAPLVTAAGGARTVAVVCRGSSTQGGALYTNRITANWRSCQLYNLAGSTYALGTGSSNITFTAPPTILNTDHLIIWTEDGAGNLTVTVDGTLAALSSGTIADAENGIVGFELANAGGNGFIGSVPLWLIADTALAGANLTSMKAWIALKYALTVA